MGDAITGDSVSQGDLISIVSSESKPNEEDQSNTEEKETEQAIQKNEDPSESSQSENDYDLIVLGAGPWSSTQYNQVIIIFGL